MSNDATWVASGKAVPGGGDPLEARRLVQRREGAQRVELGDERVVDDGRLHPRPTVDDPVAHERRLGQPFGDEGGTDRREVGWRAVGPRQVGAPALMAPASSATVKQAALTDDDPTLTHSTVAAEEAPASDGGPSDPSATPRPVGDLGQVLEVGAGVVVVGGEHRVAVVDQLGGTVEATT